MREELTLAYFIFLNDELPLSLFIRLTSFFSSSKYLPFVFCCCSLQSEEMCLLPKTYNMFKQTCDVSKELNLGNYGIGNTYFQVFAEALKVD